MLEGETLAELAFTLTPGFLSSNVVATPDETTVPTTCPAATFAAVTGIPNALSAGGRTALISVFSSSTVCTIKGLS